jgi:hypothetical protein
LPIPTWSVGQVLASADVNTWFVPLAVIKPADTGRVNTTSMTGDPDLLLPVVAAASYYIGGVIFYDGPAAGSSDIKWTFTIPSGASGQYAAARQNLSASYVGAFAFSWGDTVTANTSGTGTIMVIGVQGLLQTTSTAGSLRLSWAQNTANPTTNTHVKAQSFLTAQRIS